MSLEEVVFSDDNRFFFLPKKLKGVSVKITFSSLYGFVLTVRPFYYTFILNKLSHCSQWICFQFSTYFDTI